MGSEYILKALQEFSEIFDFAWQRKLMKENRSGGILQHAVGSQCSRQTTHTELLKV